MGKKEEIIDLEQIIKEAELRLKELSEDELTKVSGGFDNAVLFEKGKWIRDGEDVDPEFNAVYELLELNGDEIMTNMWIQIRASTFFGYTYIVKCLQNRSIPVTTLIHAIEVPRPDWAHE